MFATHLFCPKCKIEYPIHHSPGVCTCEAPLLVDYDWDAIKTCTDKQKLRAEVPTIWRYKEFLPVRMPESIISMGEGMTPLVEIKQLGQQIDLHNMYLKDESLMPTGSFKARGASVGVSMAKELGATTIAMPTNGNAGSAWAAYGARAGLRVVLVMSDKAPEIYQKEMHTFGASVFQVPGLITDAGKIVAQSIEEHGWLNVATFKEPFRIEGKKTLGLEIAEQYNWEAPDTIIVPCGGGLGIIGIYKAFTELQKIGWIGDKLPRLVGVQSTGCAPIVRAFEQGKPDVEYWENAETCAFGINAPRPLGAFLTLDAIAKSNGTAIAVTDEEMLLAQQALGKYEGLFVCPEGAATFAAAQKLRQQGWLDKHERIVLINSCTGLKYSDTVQCTIPLIPLNSAIA